MWNFQRAVEPGWNEKFVRDENSSPPPPGYWMVVPLPVFSLDQGLVKKTDQATQ